MIRWVKVIRLMKFKNIYNRMNPVSRGIWHMSIAFERLLFLLALSLLTWHIIGCFWLFVGKLYLDFDENSLTWLRVLPSDVDGDQLIKYKDFSNTNQYFASLYMTLRVGLGEEVALNNFEMYGGMVIMLIGAIFMTLAIPAVTQIISSFDHNNAKFVEKMETLDNLFERYQFPLDLYSQLRRTMRN